jgi:hypothetical protein
VKEEKQNIYATTVGALFEKTSRLWNHISLGSQNPNSAVKRRKQNNKVEMEDKSNSSRLGFSKKSLEIGRSNVVC